MSQRLKTISRIARLIEHRREILELEVLQIQQKLNQEKSLLVNLKNEVQRAISTFEQGLKNQRLLNSGEVTALYEISRFLLVKVEGKDKEVTEIGRELEVRRDVLFEAYKKEKAFGLFRNKMVYQERREEGLGEQKTLDYLNLVKRS